MALSPDETQELKHQLWDLRPDQCAQDRKRYEDLRTLYIGHAEGWMPHAYRDVLGLVTVGVGFNMDRTEARLEWQGAFPEGAVDFDAVYGGTHVLSEAHMQHLFGYGLARREAQLREAYGGAWSALRANERLATESAYYNGACLVDASTRYYAALTRYALTQDRHFLDEAVLELRERSNRRGIPGLANRRISEALLLDHRTMPQMFVA